MRDDPCGDAPSRIQPHSRIGWCSLRLRAAIGQLTLRAAVAGSSVPIRKNRRVDGIRVIELQDPDGGAGYFKIVSAIDALRGTRFYDALVARYIKLIVVNERVGYRYNHMSRGVIAPYERVMRSTVRELACVLVHEATHGYLLDRSLDVHLALPSLEVELFCVRAEVRAAIAMGATNLWPERWAYLRTLVKALGRRPTDAELRSPLRSVLDRDAACIVARSLRKSYASAGDRRTVASILDAGVPGGL